MNLAAQTNKTDQFALPVTVFTPTYNRGHLLKRLYESLLSQTFQKFEWIIVNDGSADNTDEIIQSFITENRISIIYIVQPNSGKQVAINQGVAVAQGELFFIVDSDDWLISNALERIFHHWVNVKKLPDFESFAGVSGNRIHTNNQVNGGAVDYEILDTDAFDYRQKRKYKGDKAEAYLTSTLQKYPFPVFEGEKYCPESLVWNRIAENYKLRYFNEGIYVGDYLEGGITDRSMIIRAIYPRYTAMVYSELVNSRKVPLQRKIKALINYWRFSPYNKQKTFGEKSQAIRPSWGILFYPIGFLIYLKERKIVSSQK